MSGSARAAKGFHRRAATRHPGASPRTPRPRREAGIGGRNPDPKAARRDSPLPSPTRVNDRPSLPTGYLANGASRVRFAERDASGPVPTRPPPAGNHRLASPNRVPASHSPLTRRQPPCVPNLRDATKAHLTAADSASIIPHIAQRHPTTSTSTRDPFHPHFLIGQRGPLLGSVGRAPRWPAPTAARTGPLHQPESIASAGARERIWAVVAAIPRGTVATYGQVAALAGLPRGARLVGRAMSQLPPGHPPAVASGDQCSGRDLHPRDGSGASEGAPRGGGGGLRQGTGGPSAFRVASLSVTVEACGRGHWPTHEVG